MSPVDQQQLYDVIAYKNSFHVCYVIGDALDVVIF